MNSATFLASDCSGDLFFSKFFPKFTFSPLLWPIKYKECLKQEEPDIWLPCFISYEYVFKFYYLIIVTYFMVISLTIAKLGNEKAYCKWPLVAHLPFCHSPPSHFENHCIRFFQHKCDNMFMIMICIYLFSYHRCDCDRQALMTALDSCHWFRADCTLLNTDLGSVYDANASMSGSVSTGADEDDEKWQGCCCWGRRWRFFALNLNGGSCNKPGGIEPASWSPPGRTATATGHKPVWSTVAVSLNATDMKLL